MKFFFSRSLFKDVSIARKLYFTIGIMATLIATELFILWFAFSTLSAVRSYVTGEGLWSKSQKNAIFQLKAYAQSHDESDYHAFLEYMKVPQGDSKAREELMKPEPDKELVRQGFLEGRNHPDDIDGMVNLVQRFHWVSYINRVIVIWSAADPLMQRLMPISETLHRLVLAGARQADIDAALSAIEPINVELTHLQDDFSFTLGEGARWLENLIVKLLLSLVLTVEITGILITISVSRGIQKGLNAIIDGSREVASGHMGTRVPVYSKDEIGVLAGAFNTMTDTLEQNIAQLKSTEEKLRQEKEKAESSEKIKRMFVANMSHEIRTPMNAILGFARLLEDSELNREQYEFVRAIVQSGDDLLVILNDILDFSKMESGHIHFDHTSVRVADIVNATASMMSIKARQKNIALQVNVAPEVPQLVIGDPVRLNQVLINLVSNGIKFTEAGSVQINVSVALESERTTTLHFSIKDTGIGIDPLQRENIFVEFEQAERSHSRRFGGTGLGLSIARQLIELQGGSIGVESVKGKGSDFFFTLPFTKTEKPTQGEVQLRKKARLPLAFERDDTKLNVLLVEDNPVNQLLVIRVLQASGHNIDLAENGKIGVDKVQAHDYDVVLMDLQMPVMDGYEATQTLRTLHNEKKRGIPIIAMTAHTMKGEYDKCMEVGMNDFISKPFLPDELLDKLSQHGRLR